MFLSERKQMSKGSLPCGAVAIQITLTENLDSGSSSSLPEMSVGLCEKKKCLR